MERQPPPLERFLPLRIGDRASQFLARMTGALKAAGSPAALTFVTKGAIAILPSLKLKQTISAPRYDHRNCSHQPV
ncbi:MAG: hypothetical protein F6K28_47075 [Microcoleus sp. SIO2G3]|nr:hypothetical protein [Microcoleus sp. SIO2G3]